MAIPVMVAVYGVPVTLSIAGAGYGRGWAISPVAFVSLTLLLFDAAWLNFALFGRNYRTLVPFPVAILAVTLILLWQAQASAVLIPKSGLTWGFFLTPEGARAGFWVLRAPFWTGVGSLAVICMVAMLAWWRNGARLALLCMIPWWIGVFVVFAVPSMFLDGQGNATLFI